MSADEHIFSQAVREEGKGQISPIKDFDTLDYHRVIGDPIRVNASDDFMVTKVKVIITNAAGVVIEKGEALPNAMRVHLWEYTATAANPSLAGTTICAVAYDRPGNKGAGEVVL